MVVLFGLITAFSWAFANVFTQQATRTRTKPAVIMFWVLLVTTAAILPFALAIDHLQGPWTPGSLAWPIAAGALADVGFFLLLRALTKGSLSVVAPIIALEGGVATVLAIALGQSPLPDLTTVGITRATSVLLILPAFLLVRELPKRANAYPILWCGLLDAVGFAFFAFAASVGPLSVASVTATQWGTAAALIGIIAMRERLFTNQYIGIAVTLLAVTGLGLAS